MTLSLCSSRVRRAAWCLPLSVLAAACTSTTLVNMWKDPTQPRQPMHSVLVVTLRKDATNRRLWEDGFVASLKAHGVDATPSYSLFPNAAPDTTELLNTVRTRGFDGVLVAHQLSASTESHYVSGYVSTEPVTYMSPWTGHYYTYFSDIYAPAYVESDRVVRYEAEVWIARNGGRVVWSGVTESLNPESTQQVNSEIADAIVPAMIKAGVMQAH